MSGQDQQAGRGSVLSYLDDYARRGDEIVFAHVRGLRTVRWSYGRLASAARRFARELEGRGVRPGERVLLCGENCAEWAAAFWGCLLRGAVAVPLDKESAPDFILSVRRQTDARLIVSGDDAAAPARLEIPRLRLENLEDEVARHDDAPYPCEAVCEDTLAEIIFTSGTTHTPKGVMITHGNLLANLAPLEAEMAKYIRWERLVHPIRFLSLVPLSHVFGQFMGLFVPQLLGGEVHFQDSLKPAEVARAARRRGVSVIALVPRMLDGLRDWVERDYEARGRALELRTKLSRAAGKHFLRRWLAFRRVHGLFGWKFWAFVCGGATLDDATETFWRRAGFAVLQGYGMTETASLITVTHPFKQSRGSVGRRLPGSEFKLDETGEIMVRGASVSPGYWAAEGGAQSPADGWLRTGDIGEVDEAGNLYFKGRKKDVIVTAAGLNIFPEDLEAALKRQPEVRDCCVIEWEGAGGAQPLAVLILRAGEADAEAAVSRANQQLADFQQIRRWHVWQGPDFPRTATHKVIKREVAATVSARLRGEGRGVEGEAARAGGHSFILAEAARLGGTHAPAGLDSSAKLATDLKLDSLGRVALLSALEERYGVEVNEAAFTAATTVGDVERLLERPSQEERVAPYPYTEWAGKFPLTWVRALLFYTVLLPITRVMSRLRVEGSANLDGLTSPALFVANHVTLADHALILAALPARLRHRLAIAMEGERLRDWLYPPGEAGWFLRLRLLAQYALVNAFFHVFPLPKRGGFRRSFAYAGECVSRGRSVLVFPEGARAPRGETRPGEFKSGVGLLAKGLGVPVVPVRLHGLYELKRRRQYFAPPGLVRVVFGAPAEFGATADPAAVAKELERRVSEL